MIYGLSLQRSVLRTVTIVTHNDELFWTEASIRVGTHEYERVRMNMKRGTANRDTTRRLLIEYQRTTITNRYNSRSNTVYSRQLQPQVER